MPIDLKKATALAVDRAITRYQHPDYERTVQLRKDYTAYMTGVGLDEKLRQFKKRETEEDFKQRKALTVFTTKSVVSAMMGPERKLVNVKPVVDSITYGKDNDTAVKELRDLTSTFYGGKDIDHYLGVLTDPADADPNGFVVLAFDNFDFRYEKPSTYPFRIAADNVWDFQYFNGRLQYLWSNFVIQYVIEEGQIDPITGKQGKPKTKDGDRFVFYADNHHIVFEQVKDTLPDKKEGVLMTADGMSVNITSDTSVTFGKTEQPLYYLRTQKETLYVVTFYDQKSGQVPAFRMGCKPDQLTDGRTCVNMWDQAVPFLEKSLMQVSELDLTTAVHVFPRLIQYGPKCDEVACNGGYGPNNEVCGTCHGTGMKTTHTTAMDHILVPWPSRGDDFKDLSNFLHYADLPVELVKVMMEIVKTTYDSAIRAMYGSDIYVKNTVAATATEKLVEQQAIYDTLQPKASWWSESRTTTTHVVASYNDKAADLRVVHRFPRNLKFETSEELFAMRKEAKESGVDQSALVGMDDAILELVFVDDPDQMKRAKTKARFNPFRGKAPEEIGPLLERALERSVLMYVEQATIFAKAEEEYEDKQVGFYDLEEKKQREVINKILDDILAERQEEKQAAQEAAMEQFKLGADPEDPGAVDEEQDPASEDKVAA